MKHTPTYALLALITTSFIGWPIFGWGQQEKTSDPPELYTNVYVVPPTFLDHGGGSGNLSTSPPQDPFANPEKAATPQPTAKEVLESYGISFSEGTSALFNRQTSQLIVRQTQDQMELVETLIDSLRESGQNHQIFLTYQIVETREPLFPEFPGENWEPETPKFDPDSGARGSNSRSFGKPTKRLNNFAVLTEAQAQVLIRKIEKEGLGKLRLAPNLISQSGSRVQMWVAEALTEIDRVIGADELSIDLNLNIFTGRPDENPKSDGVAQLTIWSGQTIALKEKLKRSGTYRTRLITARVVDPAGMPLTVASETKVDALPEKEYPPRVDLPEKQADAEPSLTRFQQESVSRADEFALRGAQLVADDDLVGAELAFIESLRQLPQHSITKDRKDAYLKQLLRVWEKLRAIGERDKTLEQESDDRLPSLFPLPEPAPEKAVNSPISTPEHPKAKELVLPRVEFKQTSLKDAVSFLQEKSMELD